MLGYNIKKFLNPSGPIVYDPYVNERYNINSVYNTQTKEVEGIMPELVVTQKLKYVPLSSNAMKNNLIQSLILTEKKNANDSKQILQSMNNRVHPFFADYGVTGANFLFPWTVLPTSLYYGADAGKDIYKNGLNFYNGLQLGLSTLGTVGGTFILGRLLSNLRGNPKVYRTSAKQYNEWVNGYFDRNGTYHKPTVNINDKNSAFIELFSHPDGHATVKRNHLVDSLGNDITHSIKNGKSRKNVIQSEFDDSHGEPIFTLSSDLVKANVERGAWKGSLIAEEVHSGNARPLTFRNITPELAEELVKFISDNKVKNVYLHCLRGTSRSGAVDKFMGDYFKFERPYGKNTSGYSPEVYTELVKAYHRMYDAKIKGLKAITQLSPAINSIDIQIKPNTVK